MADMLMCVYNERKKWSCTKEAESGKGEREEIEVDFVRIDEDVALQNWPETGAHRVDIHNINPFLCKIKATPIGTTMLICEKEKKPEG